MALQHARDWSDDEIIDPSYLDGLVLTHRLTAEEIDGGYLLVEPDLALVPNTLAESSTVLDGWRVEVTDAETARIPGLVHRTVVLRGDRGWLGAFTPGDLVAFRLGPPLTMERVDEADLVEDDTLPHLLATAFEELADGDTTAGRALLAAVVQDHDHFARPRRPLTELLRSAGLEVHEHLVARPGFDFATYSLYLRTWQRAVDRAREMDKRDEAAVAPTMCAFFVHLVQPDSPVLAEMLRVAAEGLRDPLVTNLYLAPWTCLDHPDDVVARDAHRRFARAVLDAAGREEPAGAHVILATCAEAEGDIATHESNLKAALQIDPGFEPAVQAMFRLLNDRGDIAAITRLISRIRTTFPARDPKIPATLYRQAGPFRAAGHEPCPCGSGRNYRRCCKASNGWSLALRVPWLFDKVERFAGQMPQWGAVRSLGQLYEPMDDDGMWMLHHTSGLLRQLVLFEGGLLARYIVQRGALLPADERELLDSWLAVRHRVWSVLDHDAESGVVRLRDHGTGTPLWARIPFDVAPPAAPFIAIVLPDGTGHCLVGTTLVMPPHAADEMAAVAERADAEDLVRAIGARLGAALGRATASEPAHG